MLNTTNTPNTRFKGRYLELKWRYRMRKQTLSLIFYAGAEDDVQENTSGCVIEWMQEAD